MCNLWSNADGAWDTTSCRPVNYTAWNVTCACDAAVATEGGGGDFSSGSAAMAGYFADTFAGASAGSTAGSAVFLQVMTGVMAGVIDARVQGFQGRGERVREEGAGACLEWGEGRRHAWRCVLCGMQGRGIVGGAARA